MGIEPGKTRVSGETAADEEAQEEVDKLSEPMEQELPEEKDKKWRTPGFARMRMDWRSTSQQGTWIIQT